MHEVSWEKNLMENEEVETVAVEVITCLGPEKREVTKGGVGEVD